MKGLFALCLVVALTGCGTKSVVQPWTDSRPAIQPYSGPVCLLPKKLPSGTEFTLLGRAVANQQWYGGYADVNNALANVARGVGADVVTEKQQRMKIGLIAWARPQVSGYAVRLKNPETFDCVASGGAYFGAGYAQSGHSAARPAETYDSCMAKVMKISDPNLRLSSMSTCDSVK